MARKQIDIRRLNDRVVTSGEEFNAVMKQIIRDAGEEAERQGRAVMLEMYRDLVRRAPKDTGRAAAGFNFSEDPSDWTPPEGEYATGKKRKKGKKGEEDEEGERVIKSEVTEAQSKIFWSMTPGRSVTISNNVEYLPALEAGHSEQAMFGFLAEAVREAKRRLEVVAEEYSRGR